MCCRLKDRGGLDNAWHQGLKGQEGRAWVVTTCVSEVGLQAPRTCPACSACTVKDTPSLPVVDRLRGALKSERGQSFQDPGQLPRPAIGSDFM